MLKKLKFKRLNPLPPFVYTIKQEFDFFWHFFSFFFASVKTISTFAHALTKQRRSKKYWGISFNNIAEKRIKIWQGYSLLERWVSG